MSWLCRSSFGIVWLALGAPSLFAQAAPLADSVVKITTTVRYPDFDRPWARLPEQQAAGSGLMIRGNRVLTCAHVVRYAADIVVETNSGTKRSFAKIVAMAPEIDLAILAVDDEGFVDAKHEVPLDAPLPALRSAVSVVGYPVGGHAQSVTEGVVSRVEFGEGALVLPLPVSVRSRSEPSTRIQIDAALNPGNSGGPAIVDGRVIGIAQSVLARAQSIGYLVASEEALKFVTAVEAGNYAGKVRILDEHHPAVNPSFRKHLKLTDEIAGVVVRRPWIEADDYPLKAGDVITAIGEHLIDNHGLVAVAADLKLRFDYYADKLATDGTIPLTVWRDGASKSVQLPWQRPNWLVPRLFGQYPSYFVYGPLVFTTVSAEYVEVSGPAWWSLWGFAKSPLMGRDFDRQSFENEQLVALAAHLPHRITDGYSKRYSQVVKSVNGQPIRNLKHFVEALRDLKETSAIIEFSEGQVETLVLDHQQALAATDQVLEDNGIRARGSQDVLEVWNAGR